MNDDSDIQLLKEAQMELLAQAGEERMLPALSRNRMLQICEVLERLVEEKGSEHHGKS
jgi:hypothetical protein